jgi:hypothetical protein
LFSLAARRAAVAAPQPKPSEAAVDSTMFSAEPTFRAASDPSFNIAGWALGAIVALAISFGVGYTVVATLQGTHVANPAEPPSSKGESTIDASRRQPGDEEALAPGTARRSGDARPSRAERKRGSSTTSRGNESRRW